MAGHCQERATTGGRSGDFAVHSRKNFASRHNAGHDVGYAGSRDFVEVRAEAGSSLHAAAEEDTRFRDYPLDGDSGMSCAGSAGFLGRLYRVSIHQGGSWRFCFRVCSG